MYRASPVALVVGFCVAMVSDLSSVRHNAVPAGCRYGDPCSATRGPDSFPGLVIGAFTYLVYVKPDKSGDACPTEEG
ncbi:hypothetical protein GCM10009800_42510 [Nocardiopsis rhodophaea]